MSGGYAIIPVAKQTTNLLSEYVQYTAPGGGVQTTVKTVTIPANTFNTEGNCVYITVLGNMQAPFTNSVLTIVDSNGNTFLDYTFPDNMDEFYQANLVIFKNNNPGELTNYGVMIITGTLPLTYSIQSNNTYTLTNPFDILFKLQSDFANGININSIDMKLLTF
jgi:hypothetical protein